MTQRNAPRWLSTTQCRPVEQTARAFENSEATDIRRLPVFASVAVEVASTSPVTRSMLPLVVDPMRSWGSEERDGNVVPGGYLNRIVHYARSAEALDGAVHEVDDDAH
jgi:hypothetical protein